MLLHHVVILALVQGMTEFLPISSTGHLLLARYILGIPDVAGNAFDAFLHLGTLLAVLVYYWWTWWRLLRSLLPPYATGQSDRTLVVALCIGTVPAALIGYFFQEQFEILWRSPRAVAAQLLITAAVLALADRRRPEASAKDRPNHWDALLVGLAQTVALVPGISRSGMTLAAGRARGLSRASAATFSFLLSAPIVAGAGLLSLSTLAGSDAVTTRELWLGLIVSAASGVAAIAFMVALVKRFSVVPFVIYLVLVAALILYVS